MIYSTRASVVYEMINVLVEGLVQMVTVALRKL